MLPKIALFSLTLLIGCTVASENSLQQLATDKPAMAIITEVARSKDQLSFKVRSTGCTSQAHLALDIQAVDNNSAQQLTLRRTQADRCRRLPFAIWVHYSLADYSLGQAPIVISNPLSPPFGK